MFVISQNGMHVVNVTASNLISIDIMPKTSAESARRKDSDPAVPEYYIELCVAAGYHPDRIIMGTYAGLKWVQQVVELIYLGVLDDGEECFMPPKEKKENNAADQ